MVPYPNWRSSPKSALNQGELKRHHAHASETGERHEIKDNEFRILSDSDQWDGNQCAQVMKLTVCDNHEPVRAALRLLATANPYDPTRSLFRARAKEAS